MKRWSQILDKETSSVWPAHRFVLADVHGWMPPKSTKSSFSQCRYRKCWCSAWSQTAAAWKLLFYSNPAVNMAEKKTSGSEGFSISSWKGDTKHSQRGKRKKIKKMQQVLTKNKASKYTKWKKLKHYQHHFFYCCLSRGLLQNGTEKWHSLCLWRLLITYPKHPGIKYSGKHKRETSYQSLAKGS